MKKILSYILMIALFVSMSGLGNIAKAADTTSNSFVVSNMMSGATSVWTVFFTAPTQDITAGSFVLTFSGGTLTATPVADVAFIPDEHQPSLTIGTPTVNGSVLTVPFTGTYDNAYGVGIKIDGNTNPGPGTLSVDIQAKSGGTTIDQSVTDPSVTIADNTVSQSVNVAKVMTYTISDTTHEYVVNPALTALAFDTASAAITIKSNAATYDLTLANDGLASTTDSIGAVALDYASWTTQVGFGFSVVKNGASDTMSTIAVTGANNDATGSATNYKALGTVTNILDNEPGVNNTADAIDISYKVLVDYTVEADSYTSTSTYVLTPTYN
ncbi:MAG: hypothetical protein ACD_58C00064G0001 [uncultured bacterium]|nr:MAG: hypothetical protein ACD_58C00064G0001 [uncultured bacterium]